MKKQLIIKTIGSIFGIAGYALLFSVNWKVAIGVFLVFVFRRLDDMDDNL